MATPVHSFRPAPVVQSTVARNGGGRGLSHRLAQIADRYATILDRASVDLSDQERAALRDLLSGTISEPAEVAVGSLADGWRDALSDGIAAKWGVDGEALLRRMEQLTPAEEFALIEEIEGWWAAVRDARGA